MPQTGAITLLHSEGLTEDDLWQNELLLVEECVNGNRLAKKVLYEKHYPMLLGVSIRYIGNQQEAEDILHESFIKIFHSIGKFKKESGLNTWLTRIVINDCLGFLKKRNRSMVEYLDELPESPEEEVNFSAKLNEFSCDRIIELMNELPAGYKAVLCLFSIDGWSHKEIGRKLKIRESTSRSQLTKARRMFQEIMNNAKP